MKWMLASLLSVILLSGCGRIGPATDSFCFTAKPQYVSAGTVLTEADARDILAHNEYGHLKCGWPKSPRKGANAR